MSISSNLQDQSFRKIFFSLFPIDFAQSEEPRTVLKLELCYLFNIQA